MNNFGIPYDFFNGFVAFLKNTLHLRNYISHNNVIYNADVPHQCPNFLNLYEFVFKKHIDRIELIHMMQLIEFFSHSTTLVSNTRYYYNKLKIQQKFKDKINLFREINNG
jgi:hypothetical protein